MALSVMAKKQQEPVKKILDDFPNSNITSGVRKKLGVFRTSQSYANGGILKPFKYIRASIDTAGYAKGKPEYELKIQEGEGDDVSLSPKKNTSKKVSWKDVPSVLQSLKK